MITEGMTPAQFVAEINTQCTDMFPSSTTITVAITSSQLETALNANFSKSDTLVGIKGSILVNTINSHFAEHDVSLGAPTNLAVTWIDDFLRITFDESSGNQCEVWEQRDLGTYVLAHTLNSETIDYKTWQNSDLNYRIRAKNGSMYSPFTTVVNIYTPLILKTDQSTLSQIAILTLDIYPTFTININWGDGTNTDFTGNNDSITKDYGAEGTYFITISNANHIGNLGWTENHIFGDLTKWRLPQGIGLFHFYSNNVTGDITNWVLPSTIGIFHIASCNFSGNISNWVIPTGIYDLRLDDNNLTGDLTNFVLPENGKPIIYFTCANNNFTGDISGWVLPSNLTQLALYGNNFTGDLTDWVIPVTLSRLKLAMVVYPGNNFTGDITDWGFATTESGSLGNEITCPNIPFTGDLSGWTIFAGTKVIALDFTNANLTKLPRGNFRWVSVFSFSANNCNTSEIDNLLAYIDAYFVGGVVPLTDAVYTLNGAGMGIPSAAGLISRTSILGKYTASGKTCTISVNS
jgi:hypothetical protein